MSNTWKLVVVAGFVASLTALAGCGEKKHEGAKGDAGSKSESAKDDDSSSLTPEEQMAKQAEETRKALKDAAGGKEIKAVDTKELKALLPETIAGAKRTGVESQKMNQGGMEYSTTNANYDPPQEEGGDGKPKPSYRVQIMDLGNLSGGMAMGFAMWATMEVEKETETGYEKSVKVNGYPALEKYDRESKSGELQVFVAKRFILEVSGNDATIEQIRAAVDAIDTGKLAGLAK
jgi:hypothetical protein